VKVVCGARRGPLSPPFYETATAGWPVASGNTATAVRATLRTPQSIASALDGVVAEA